MTTKEAKPEIAAVNELFSKSPDGLREIVRAVMQEMLEAEMTDALGADKGERPGEIASEARPPAGPPMVASDESARVVAGAVAEPSGRALALLGPDRVGHLGFQHLLHHRANDLAQPIRALRK